MTANLQQLKMQVVEKSQKGKYLNEFRIIAHLSCQNRRQVARSRRLLSELSDLMAIVANSYICCQTYLFMLIL